MAGSKVENKLTAQTQRVLRLRIAFCSFIILGAAAFLLAAGYSWQTERHVLAAWVAGQPIHGKVLAVKRASGGAWQIDYGPSDGTSPVRHTLTDGQTADRWKPNQTLELRRTQTGMLLSVFDLDDAQGERDMLLGVFLLCFICALSSLFYMKQALLRALRLLRVGHPVAWSRATQSKQGVEYVVDGQTFHRVPLVYPHLATAHKDLVLLVDPIEPGSCLLTRQNCFSNPAQSP